MNKWYTIKEKRPSCRYSIALVLKDDPLHAIKFGWADRDDIYITIEWLDNKYGVIEQKSVDWNNVLCWRNVSNPPSKFPLVRDILKSPIRKEIDHPSSEMWLIFKKKGVRL
jgi:hypothetical protein